MRISKYVGFVAMVLGALLVVSTAVLPVTVDRGGAGLSSVRFRVDGCGPAMYAAVRDSEPECQRTAQRRLLGSTTAGLLMAVAGLVMFAGGDSRGSRVVAPTRRARRRPPAGSPGRDRLRHG